MEHLHPLSTGKRLNQKPPARELMAAARQARAESLRSMMSGLGRRLRSTVAIHLLPARQPIAGAASSSELELRPGT